MQLFKLVINANVQSGMGEMRSQQRASTTHQTPDRFIIFFNGCRVLVDTVGIQLAPNQ